MTAIVDFCLSVAFAFILKPTQSSEVLHSDSTLLGQAKENKTMKRRKLLTTRLCVGVSFSIHRIAVDMNRSADVNKRKESQ